MEDQKIIKQKTTEEGEESYAERVLLPSAIASAIEVMIGGLTIWLLWGSALKPFGVTPIEYSSAVALAAIFIILKKL